MKIQQVFALSSTLLIVEQNHTWLMFSPKNMKMLTIEVEDGWLATALSLRRVTVSSQKSTVTTLVPFLCFASSSLWFAVAACDYCLRSNIPHRQFGSQFAIQIGPTIVSKIGWMTNGNAIECICQEYIVLDFSSIPVNFFLLFKMLTHQIQISSHLSNRFLHNSLSYGQGFMFVDSFTATTQHYFYHCGQYHRSHLQGISPWPCSRSKLLRQNARTVCEVTEIMTDCSSEFWCRCC